MSGVAISLALRERARKGLQYVYKKKGKEATFIEVFELERAYVLSGNDAEKFVTVINERLREIYEDCNYFVLSDADEQRLRETFIRDGNNLIWCIFVFNCIGDIIDTKAEENAKKLRDCYRLIDRTYHSISTDKVHTMSVIIPKWVEFTKKVVKDYQRAYLRGLHQMYSNDLTRFVLKKEGNLQKIRMQLHLQTNERDLKIGPNNLVMSYSQIPEFLKQFPESIVPREFSDLCRALALVCHNSDYGKQQANQFAEEHERNLKRLKTKE